jgi:hypothetical protein
MRVNPLRRSPSLDVPDVVLHMTGRSGRKTTGVRPEIVAFSSSERLASIIWERQLRAATVHGCDWPVVCFTHTTRRALAAMTSQFDGVGIAFHVQSVFAAGGGPVLYVRGDEYDAVQGNPSLSEAFRSRIVRWWPGASEEDAWKDILLPHSLAGPSEWTHEREWRIPQPGGGGWAFSPDDVAFVLLPNDNYIAAAGKALSSFEANPSNPPSDLSWVKDLPVATRTNDGWTFRRGDALGWT